MGSFQGDFSSLAAHDLGGAAIKAAVERAGISADLVTEVLFGNCLMAGQGQAPARQAGFKGGLPKSAGAVTLSKMCGSGMRAAMFAHDMLLAGTHDVLVAGGMESMTNAPYLMLKGRGGYRLGHDRIFDHCDSSLPFIHNLGSAERAADRPRHLRHRNFGTDIGGRCWCATHHFLCCFLVGRTAYRDDVRLRWSVYCIRPSCVTSSNSISVS